MKIIGRVREQAELERYFLSGRPEFIAVTGRRRVGKTFLIRAYFSESMTFYFSGVTGKNASNTFQLRQFDDAIAKQGGHKQGAASECWADAFAKLQKLIENSDTQERRVIFIDELPWLDTPKNDFLPALDYFWNTFASLEPRVMLIVCGSAASWLARNLFENKGGLHNRITGRLNLAPFTLGECEDYFEELGVRMNRYQIAESYMVFGGIPYYLGLFAKGYGLTQNIDRLLFTRDAPLKNEFYEVYRSLFNASDRHIALVSALSETGQGQTRNEISKASGIPSGGNLTRTLRELEQCGFIETYADFTKQKYCAYYRLADPFTLFWLKFVQGNNTKDEYYWTNRIDNGARRAWSGYAFEQLCFRHIAQIKQKLGILGVATEVFSWHSKAQKPGAQIDLLISRRDEVINICEMKYSLHPLTLSQKDDQALQNKRVAFLQETGTHKALHITMVTTYGLTKQGDRASVQSEVTLDDLFGHIH